eukprot:TRINITY_DN16842_c0_g3_i1.p1 TRINITY_DN16842_c0_g3~~TRINITY_DN16842_c0_g3_i1.p1  ORF type:complete len:1199 (+),score=294.11 TRINITY_DN16842_c0_g3_i1:79-3675(+)
MAALAMARHAPEQEPAVAGLRQVLRTCQGSAGALLRLRQAIENVSAELPAGVLEQLQDASGPLGNNLLSTASASQALQESYLVKDQGLREAFSGAFAANGLDLSVELDRLARFYLAGAAVDGSPMAGGQRLEKAAQLKTLLLQEVASGTLRLVALGTTARGSLRRLEQAEEIEAILEAIISQAANNEDNSASPSLALVFVFPLVASLSAPLVEAVLRRCSAERLSPPLEMLTEAVSFLVEAWQPDDESVLGGLLSAGEEAGGLAVNLSLDEESGRIYVERTGEAAAAAAPPLFFVQESHRRAPEDSQQLQLALQSITKLMAPLKAVCGTSHETLEEGPGLLLGLCALRCAVDDAGPSWLNHPIGLLQDLAYRPQLSAGALAWAYSFLNRAEDDPIHEEEEDHSIHVAENGSYPMPVGSVSQPAGLPLTTLRGPPVPTEEVRALHHHLPDARQTGAENPEKSDVKALFVECFKEDLLQERRLLMSQINNLYKLRANGKALDYKKLGFERLHDFLLSIPGLAVIGFGNRMEVRIQNRDIFEDYCGQFEDEDNGAHFDKPQPIPESFKNNVLEIFRRSGSVEIPAKYFRDLWNLYFPGVRLQSKEYGYRDVRGLLANLSIIEKVGGKYNTRYVLKAGISLDAPPLPPTNSNLKPQSLPLQEDNRRNMKAPWTSPAPPLQEDHRQKPRHQPAPQQLPPGGIGGGGGCAGRGPWGARGGGHHHLASEPQHLPPHMGHRSGLPSRGQTGPGIGDFGDFGGGGSDRSPVGADWSRQPMDIASPSARQSALSMLSTGAPYAPQYAEPEDAAFRQGFRMDQDLPFGQSFRQEQGPSQSLFQQHQQQQQQQHQQLQQLQQLQLQKQAKGCGAKGGNMPDRDRPAMIQPPEGYLTGPVSAPAKQIGRMGLGLQEPMHASLPQPSSMLTSPALGGSSFPSDLPSDFSSLPPDLVVQGGLRNMSADRFRTLDGFDDGVTPSPKPNLISDRFRTNDGFDDLDYLNTGATSSGPRADKFRTNDPFDDTEPPSMPTSIANWMNPHGSPAGELSAAAQRRLQRRQQRKEAKAGIADSSFYLSTPAALSSEDREASTQQGKFDMSLLLQHQLPQDRCSVVCDINQGHIISFTQLCNSLFDEISPLMMVSDLFADNDRQQAMSTLLYLSVANQIALDATQLHVNTRHGPIMVTVTGRQLLGSQWALEFSLDAGSGSQ